MATQPLCSKCIIGRREICARLSRRLSATSTPAKALMSGLVRLIRWSWSRSSENSSNLVIRIATDITSSIRRRTTPLRCRTTASVAEPGRRCAVLCNSSAKIRVIRGSVLLLCEQLRLICGRFEKTKQNVDQQSRSAELEARAESCPERCTSQIENLPSCVGATHGADALGEIYFCDFPAANLRNSHPNIFYRFCARDGNATSLGGRRILVLFT